MGMYCKFCGAGIKNGSMVCPDCGRDQRELYGGRGDARPKMLRKRTFWKTNYYRKLPIILSSILCLLAAAAELWRGFGTATVRFWSFFDAGILLACGFMILFFRSRFFAVILSAYAIYTAYLEITVNPFFPEAIPEVLRLVVLAAAVLAVIGCFRFRTCWNRYRREYRLRFPAGHETEDATDAE